jgi:hypothetical protein
MKTKIYEFNELLALSGVWSVQELKAASIYKGLYSFPSTVMYSLLVRKRSRKNDVEGKSWCWLIFSLLVGRVSSLR